MNGPTIQVPRAGQRPRCPTTVHRGRGWRAGPRWLASTSRRPHVISDRIQVAVRTHLACGPPPALLRSSLPLSSRRVGHRCTYLGPTRGEIWQQYPSSLPRLLCIGTQESSLSCLSRVLRGGPKCHLCRKISSEYFVSWCSMSCGRSMSRNTR